MDRFDTIVNCFVATVLFVAIAAFGVAIVITMKENSHIHQLEPIVVQYRLLNINPPKHMYVDLEDVKSGEILTHKWVSKHCLGYKETAIIGKVYDVVVIPFMDDRINQIIRYDFRLYDALCK